MHCKPLIRVSSDGGSHAEVEEGREGRSGQYSGVGGEGLLDPQMPGTCQGHRISSSGSRNSRSPHLLAGLP